MMMILAASTGGLKAQTSKMAGGSTDIGQAVVTILNAVYLVVGIIAVTMIIIGGINILTSNGNPEKTGRGRRTILYGLIGLAITLLAFAITQFVLNALNGRN